MTPLHRQPQDRSIKVAAPAWVEHSVLLERKEPLPGWRNQRLNRALLLVNDSGAITGGYLDAQLLNAAQAQLQLGTNAWQAVSAWEIACNPWSDPIPEEEEKD
jgi:hypothetical protein